MKKLWTLVLAGCIAVVLSTTAWAGAPSTSMDIVTDETDLIGMLANQSSTSIRLDFDIEVSSTLVVEKNVTLDLNGHVLRLKEGKSGSVIHVKSGTLTLVDEYNRISAPPTHDFTVGGDGLWTLDETNGTKTVEGGVITGGKGGTYTYGNPVTVGYNNCGGGVYVAPGASFVMSGGNIVGCSAKGSDGGGGVFVSDGGKFKMTGGTISGCVAGNGGGLSNHGTATLSDTAKIESCHATGTGDNGLGGGVCSRRNLTVSENVEITGCTAANDISAAMYAEGGSGGDSSINGGTFNGSVLFYKNGNDTLTVSGGTFNGKVTFDSIGTNGSVTVSGGTFNGDVSGANVVTFDTDGGSANPDKQVRANSKVNKPDDPTKEGYIFEGWYDGDVKFDFEQVVSGERAVTLKAKWTKEPVVEQPKYYYKASGSGETTETKGSPKTFDAGVGVYVGMAVLSVSGSAVVLRKKRK